MPESVVPPLTQQDLTLPSFLCGLTHWNFLEHISNPGGPPNAKEGTKQRHMSKVFLCLMTTTFHPSPQSNIEEAVDILGHQCFQS